ncbi:SCO family protein [Undibacterium terreum]|uniref:Thioredoxin domain-containing protein n=1 Tax=Undibacterium terreum TaxID=1224302 RepID=A0A916U2C4_9BURK|nr:SCO family protein [Undibacterium terreum]GGC57481.1 hypothetical protein GCM10011396_00400 [Undibacterium terreum]
MMSSQNSRNNSLQQTRPDTKPDAGFLSAPTLAALLLIFVLGTAAIYHATDSFRVVSTEDGRRLAIAEHPRQIPEAAVSYANGQQLQLSQALHSDSRVAIVTFIYTRCNTICSILGTELQQMQGHLQQRGLQQQLRLLSISFDDSDGPAELSAYAKRMQANPKEWQFMRVNNAVQRQALLDSFGIVVVPAPLGEFQHNAAFHVVTPDGKLARIFDYDEPDAALEYAAALSQQQTPLAQKQHTTAHQAAL